MPTNYSIINKETKEPLKVPDFKLNWANDKTGIKYLNLINAVAPDKYVIDEVVISNRDAVNNYLNSGKVRSKCPLIFKTNNYSSRNEEVDIRSELDSCRTLEDKVLCILRYARGNPSYKKDNTHGYETSGGRRRSSLDVWRHLITYYPELTIFEVMSSLCKLELNRLINSNYCYDVRRRVFLPGNYYGWDSYKDEYGLHLTDWENI
jgi:hypothetical protein